MPILTQEQREEIEEIIQEHHTALIAKVAGTEALTMRENQSLSGTRTASLSPNPVEESYLFGQVMEHLETPAVGEMTLHEFRNLVRKKPVPLTDQERSAIRRAKAQAAQNIRNLSDRVGAQVSDLISVAEQREGLQDAVAAALETRRSAQTLAGDLGRASKDWSRDWKRVAATELQSARLEGLADRTRHGGDAWVFRRPAPGACKHCLRLHIGPDGHPRIFRLSTLQESNVGRRKENWKVTRGPIHPWCSCELGRVPETWGFDDTGRLVPGGKGGMRYEDVEDIGRSVGAEDEFQKSQRIRVHVDESDRPMFGGIGMESPTERLESTEVHTYCVPLKAMGTDSGGESLAPPQAFGKSASPALCRRSPTLAPQEIDSHLGNRAVFTGSGGMNIAWGHPLCKPPFQAEHPAVTYKPEKMVAEATAGKETDREQVGASGRRTDLSPGESRAWLPVHAVPREAQLRAEASAEIRAQIPRVRDRLNQRVAQRTGAQISNMQPVHKAGPLEVGEEIVQNKKNLGTVTLRREAGDAFRVLYDVNDSLNDRVCKSLTAASEHVWAVQKGFESADDYRQKTGNRRVPAGAGLRFWGLHKMKQRRRVRLKLSLGRSVPFSTEGHKIASP